MRTPDSQKRYGPDTQSDTPSNSPLPREQKSFVQRFQTLFGQKDAQPRRRKSDQPTVPAHIETFEHRAMNSASPAPVQTQTVADIAIHNLHTQESENMQTMSNLVTAMQDAVAQRTQTSNEIDTSPALRDQAVLNLQNLADPLAKLTKQTADAQTPVDSLSASIVAIDQKIADLKAHPEKSGSTYTLPWLSDTNSIGTLPGSAGKETFAIAVSPNGSLIARGDRAGNTELIDALTGKILVTVGPGPNAGNAYMCDLAFNADGTRLAALHSGGRISIIDTKTLTATMKTIRQDNFFANMRWMGNEICIGMQGDGAIYVVNADTGALRGIAPIGGTNGIAIVHGNTIFAGGSYGPMTLSGSDGTLLAQAPSPGIVATVTASQDGSLLAAITYNGIVTVYDSSLRVLGTDTSAGSAYRVSFLPGNKGLVVYDAKGRFVAYDLSQMANGTLGTPTVIPTNTHQGYSNSMGVAPDGSVALNIDPNNGIRATRLPAGLILPSAEKAIKQLSEQRAPLDTSLTQARVTLKGLTDALTPLQNQAQALRDTIATLNDHIPGLPKKLSDLNAQIDGIMVSIRATLLRKTELDNAMAQAGIDPGINDGSDVYTLAMSLVEKEETTALAKSLADSVSVALNAEANKIGYAKMFVSFTQQGSSTLFTVRFRSPNPTTNIQVRIDNNDGSYGYQGADISEPTKDGTWSFALSMRSNVGGQDLRIRLSDGTTHQILVETHAAYYPQNNSAAVSATQMPFELEEAGLLAENPIVPDVQVQSIQGPNILLAVQSPHDQTNLYFPNVAGMLSHQQLDHVGGTTYMPAMLTFDATRPTGDYDLNMGDGSSGLVNDVIHLHWDQGSKSLSLTNAKDQYTNPQNTGADTSTFTAIMSLTSAILSDKQINIIQQSRLYDETISLAAPYNFAALNFMDRIEQLHPEYKEANWQQGIDAVWNQIGHSFTRGRAEQIFQDGRVQYINAKRAMMSTYYTCMGTILQQGVNVLIQVRQGGNETQLINGVRQTIDGFNNVAGIKAQNYTASQLNGLQELGISLPSYSTIMNAAHMLLDRGWQKMVVAQQDVVAYQQALDNMKAAKDIIDAKTKFKATGGNVSALPATMTRREITLAAKINDTLAKSTDKRVAGVSSSRQQQTAILVASIATTDPVQKKLQTDAILKDQAHKALTDDYISKHQAELQSAIDSAVQNGSLPADQSKAVFQWINQASERLTESGLDIKAPGNTSLMNAVANFVNGNFTIQTAEAAAPEAISEAQGMVNIDGLFSVNADSAIGAVFITMKHVFYDDPNVTRQISMSQSMQKVTGIDWKKFMRCIYDGTSRRTEQDGLVQIQKLFISEKYGNIFNAPTSTNVQILASSTDKSSYTDADSSIRVRFDYMTPSHKYDHVGIYLADASGHPLDESAPIISFAELRYYADVPMSKVADALQKEWQKLYPTIKWDDKVWLQGHYTFRVAIWDTNVKDSPALQGAGLKMNPFSIDFQEINNNLSTNPDQDLNAKEKSILSQLAFPLDSNNWSYTMGSSYHKGPGLYALDLSSTNDEGMTVDVAATGIIEKVDLSQGEVILRHTLPDGTIWRTTYFHMTHILEGITGIAYIGDKEATRTGVNSSEASAGKDKAQLAINALIAQGKELLQNTTLGKVGTEGDSTGPHLHFQVDIGTNQSVDLFHWISTKQPGFTLNGMVGNKNLELHWSDIANAMVNDSEHIAMHRVNILDENNIIVGAENLAFAFESGLDINHMIKVVWKNNNWVDAANDKKIWKDNSWIIIP